MIRVKCIFFILVISITFNKLLGQEKKVISPHVNPVLRFTENLGQWNNSVLFRAQLDGGLLFVQKNGLTFNFYDKVKYRAIHHGAFMGYPSSDFEIKRHSFKINFIECNQVIKVEKLQQGNDYENFFIGSDKSAWRGLVKNYSQIFLRNIYDYIDYEALTTVNGIKYNFIIKPGGDPKKIRLGYEGVDKLKLKKGVLTYKLEVNEIVEQKPYAYQIINGVVKEIKCNYVVKDKVLSFEFPDGYDTSYQLVLDPILVFAAQSGSYADNFGMTATFDKAGNLYSGGTVFDVGFPTTIGAYSSSFNGPAASGNTDIVITKYNSSGNALIYSTYLGGSGSEIVTSLITDSLNNLYLYGATSSSNFPTQNPYDGTFNGGNSLNFVFNGTNFINGTDIYISKFNAAGSNLLGSTYIGGTNNDGVNYNNALSTYTTPLCLFNTVPAPTNFYIQTITNESKADSLQYNYGDQYRGEIQLDKNLNVYITSSTRSSDFPIVGGFDNSLGGKQDAVILKLSNNLSNLLYSSYLGGSGNDAGYSLIVDDTLQAFITGGTYSNDFPTVAGCYQTTYNGGKADGFIVKINSSGNAILKSTYIGTPNYDQSFFIQSDAQGRIYVFGQSLGNMPVSSNVYSNPNSHQFISRLNRQLTTIDKSTVFGSGTPSIDISPSAFAVDICNGNVYLSGWGGSFINCTPISGMPTTTNALYTSPPNGVDFYLMALGPNLGSLLYGSYFGGNKSAEHVDGGTSRFDKQGVIYQSVCAGCTSYTMIGVPPASTIVAQPGQDFPVTPGAWPAASSFTPLNFPNKSNNCNNGVFKLDFKLQNALSSISVNTITGCQPLTLTLTNNNPGTSFTWYLGNGNTTSVVSNPVVTYTSGGTYTISLVVRDSTKCIKKDSSSQVITVLPLPSPGFSLNFSPCGNTVTVNNTSTGTLTANPYVWNFGDGSQTVTATSPSHTYNTTGIFTISLQATGLNGCKATTTKTVSIFNFNPGVTNGVICEGLGINLNATGGTSYSWTPSSGLSNTNTPSPNASPTVTTIYTIEVENNTPGYSCFKTLTTQVTVHPKPVAHFNYSINPCGGGVNYIDSSYTNVTAWDWTLTPTQTSTVQNPYYFYSNGGNFTVSLIATNSFGCKDTVNYPVSVPVPPPLSVNGNSLICKGNNAQLIAGGGISYTWYPSAHLNSPNSATPLASPTVSTIYTVVITTSNNCTFTLNTMVQVYNLSNTPISANANPPSVVQGNSSLLSYTGDAGATVSWFPSNTVSPKTGYTVNATPDRPTTYTVVAVNGACRETLYVFVDVVLAGCVEGDAFVPNTFTPNNDGQNDILYVRGLKMDEIYFAVYNRWGEMVFETKDKTKGWDGIYKGRPADVGVFGWYLKVKCVDGQETFKKGNVTLIR